MPKWQGESFSAPIDSIGSRQGFISKDRYGFSSEKDRQYEELVDKESKINLNTAKAVIAKKNKK